MSESTEKLPKWAQREFKFLLSQIEKRDKLLDEVRNGNFPGPFSYVNQIAPSQAKAQPFYLPQYSDLMVWRESVGLNGRRLYIAAEDSDRYGKALRISTPIKQIELLPECANTVIIRSGC